jgi:cytidyltransferase-like protein
VRSSRARRSSIACALNAPRGRTVAFANGCFDILHVGHVRYLDGAAQEADILVVAINDDASVKALKGKNRPILPPSIVPSWLRRFAAWTSSSSFPNPP